MTAITQERLLLHNTSIFDHTGFSLKLIIIPAQYIMVQHITQEKSILHVNSFKETRQSKQLRPKTTPFFLKRKNELPRAGFEPATSCMLGRRSYIKNPMIIESLTVNTH